MNGRKSNLILHTHTHTHTHTHCTCPVSASNVSVVSVCNNSSSIRDYMCVSVWADGLLKVQGLYSPQNGNFNFLIPSPICFIFFFLFFLLLWMWITTSWINVTRFNVLIIPLNYNKSRPCHLGKTCSEWLACCSFDGMWCSDFGSFSTWSHLLKLHAFVQIMRYPSIDLHSHPAQNI